MVENLLSYHLGNSGFMHVKSGSGNNGGGEAGKVNGMATEQGYYALVAYQRMKNGQTSLYNMSDVKLTIGGAGDGKGTGLEEPAAKPTRKPAKTAQKRKAVLPKRRPARQHREERVNLFPGQVPVRKLLIKKLPIQKIQRTKRKSLQRDGALPQRNMLRKMMKK